MSSRFISRAWIFVALLLWLGVMSLPSEAQVSPSPLATARPIKSPYLVDDLEPMPVEWPSCSVTCETNPHCSGVDQPCPACDELGSNTCSDVTLKRYNPGMANIQWAATRWDPCIKQEAKNAGQVLCHRTQSCGEGVFISFTMCSNGAACVSMNPIPMFCQLCVALGIPNDFFVENQTCHFNKCCCPGPEDTDCFPTIVP